MSQDHDSTLQHDSTMMQDHIHYVRLSKSLGLHKNALNLMAGNNLLFNDGATRKLKLTLNTGALKSQVSGRSQHITRNKTPTQSGEAQPGVQKI